MTVPKDRDDVALSALAAEIMRSARKMHREALRVRDENRARIDALVRENNALRAKLDEKSRPTLSCCHCGVELPAVGRRADAVFPVCGRSACKAAVKRRWMAEKRAREHAAKEKAEEQEKEQQP